jgi:leader peptidase (prepilin peptidase) / N-methyltransferase
VPVPLVCALLGLPAGLFAGVLVDRVPDRLPLWRPRPTWSPWGLHLAVLATTMALFVLAGVRYADRPAGELAVVLVLFTALVPLSVIDIRVLRLPDRIVGPAYLVLLGMIVVASVVWREPERIRFAIVGGLVWVVVLGLGWLVGMGFGDVKAGGVMGMVVGWLASSGVEAMVLVLWALAIGTMAASVYGIGAKVWQVLRVPREGRGRLWFAFGPFLALGCSVVVLVGRELVAS